MTSDGEQSQRSLSLDGVETETANPPQDPDGAAVAANRQRRPISDANGKKIKGESWIVHCGIGQSINSTLLAHVAIPYL